MNITPEMVKALAALRRFSTAVKQERYVHPLDKEAALAIDLLDNEDFFAPLDDEAFLTENTKADDPAEWGDTTVEDMARHQQG
jgi:hypothetical protein